MKLDFERKFAHIGLIIRLTFGALTPFTSKIPEQQIKPAITQTNSEQSSIVTIDINESEAGEAQSEFVFPGSQLAIVTPSGNIIMNIPRGGSWKFNPGGRARGAAKIESTRRQKNFAAAQMKTKVTTSTQSNGNVFVDGFLPKPQHLSVPNKNNGTFGKFFSPPTIDPRSQPGGAGGGPRSITVLSNGRNLDSSTKFKTFDGYKAELTDQSENHVTAKHGHKFGVDDPIPMGRNAKQTKYEQTRTRLNIRNKQTVRHEIDDVISNRLGNTKVYNDVDIRGTKGRVYHDQLNNRVVAVHTEGKFKGQIKKAQPISPRQLKSLREFNRLD